jgi:hypothetical protein
MAESGRKRWFAYGCFGCLGLLVLSVLLVAAAFGRAWIGARSEKVEDRVIRPGLPTVSAPDDRREEVGEGQATPGGKGRVVLRLSGGEFEVEPARRGEGARVEAKYDANTYELRESLETGEEGWTYEVGFAGTGSGLLAALKQLFGGTPPEVRVYLPPDVPLSLEMDLQRGAASVELGGLWVTRADLDWRQGALELSVDEPLRAPMERLGLRASMGGVSVSRLGNASPRRLDVDFSMGGLDLDLRGEWVVDSEIEIRHRMGGGAVRLPRRGVEIVGLDSSGFRGPSDIDREIPLPKLSFSVSSSQGELDFYD